MAKSELDILADAIGMGAMVNQTADLTIGKKPEAKDRDRVLQIVGSDLNKKFETTNSILKLGDKVGKPLPSIPTNLPTLDKYIIQCGGIPRGCIIEVFGPESSGKTTLCLHVIAQEQKTGELCAFVDAEHALDPTWAARNGVLVDDLVISQPDSGEQALETVIALVRSRAVSLIVVDSVAALVPQAELDGDMGASHMGLQARLMSQAMRKLTGICRKTGITVMFINQIREKIGVTFGSNETTTGGRALKFYSSLRLDVRRIGQIKDGEDIVGNKTKIKAVKNKVGSPFKEGEFELLYDSGFNMYDDWLQIAVDKKVIEKSGSWYSFKTERLGQGSLNTCKFLKDNPDVFSKVQKECS